MQWKKNYQNYKDNLIFRIKINLRINSNSICIIYNIIFLNYYIFKYFIFNVIFLETNFHKKNKSERP